VPFAFATQNQIHQKLVQGYADMTLMMHLLLSFQPIAASFHPAR
jgi:hypothetical protein